MTKTVRDPNGVALKRVLLQVLDSDEQGPVSLRVRRDHEQIDLSDKRHRTFLMVWVAEDQVLGELRLTDILEDFDKLKEQGEHLTEAKAQLDGELQYLKAQFNKLRAESELKTAELRVLQRERDPVRIEAMIEDRVHARTTAITAQLVQEQAVVASLTREVSELKASKRKLREALERMKEKR